MNLPAAGTSIFAALPTITATCCLAVLNLTPSSGSRNPWIVSPWQSHPVEKLHSGCFCATHCSLAISVLSKLIHRTLSQCTCKM
jgi:hypothetical protein